MTEFRIFRFGGGIPISPVSTLTACWVGAHLLIPSGQALLGAAPFWKGPAAAELPGLRVCF